MVRPVAGSPALRKCRGDRLGDRGVTELESVVEELGGFDALAGADRLVDEFGAEHCLGDRGREGHHGWAVQRLGQGLGELRVGGRGGSGEVDG